MNCTTCAAGTGLCTGCAPSFTSNLPTAGACACNPNSQALVNGACVALVTCPAYQYATNINTCASCPTYCSTCSQIYGICSVCQQNMVVVPASNSCGCSSSSFVNSGGLCYSCNTWVGNCNTCTTPGQCSTCLNGLTAVNGNSCQCTSR
jgi:hypothetical protein